MVSTQLNPLSATENFLQRKQGLLVRDFAPKMQNFYSNIKSFLRDKMYLSQSVLNKTRRGEKIIKILFTRIRNHPLKYLKRNTLKMYSKERSICDFIAGMTDRYAINLYNSIK